MSPPAAAKVRFGGDYNPEQWPEEVWSEDYRLFDAARIDTVTLGVFTWSLVQPRPDVYDFALLDRIVERATAEGRTICMATGTGAHPAWLARAFPEVTRTDFEGRRHRYGQRHNSCPSSPVFRRLSAELARRVARRYAGNPSIVGGTSATNSAGRATATAAQPRSATGCARGTSPCPTAPRAWCGTSRSCWPTTACSGSGGWTSTSCP